MKFIDYFEHSRPTDVRLLLLGGADATLKNGLRLEFLKQAGIQKEYSFTGNIQDLICLMEEGSFFGPRLFDVLFTGKVKSPFLWGTFFDVASLSPHTMVLVFEGEGGEWTDQAFKKHHGVYWFDCNFPKNKRGKTRLVTSLLSYRKITLENPDLIAEIVERVKDSLELENFLTCLKLLLEYSPKITSKDLRALLSESGQEKLDVHDLMSGKIGKLTEAIEVNEPLKVLGSWFSTLKKFYIWLAQDTLETGAPGNHDDDDDDDKVEDASGLNRYLLKEYRLAKHRYSLQLVREVLEELNAIYHDVQVGQKDHWKERARMTIQRLAPGAQ